MTHNLQYQGLKIALFEPDIPQNTAAIMRTCACLGTKLEIIEPCGFSFNDKRFKRVIMDYMDNKNLVFFKSIDHFLEIKKDQRIILMTTKGSSSYTNFKFKNNDTILFGRESAGVPEKLHKIIKNRLKIPMNNKVRSLNIASSVAIVLAESLRQMELI